MDDFPPPVDTLVTYLHEMLHNPPAPDIPPALESVEGLQNLHEYLITLRNLLDAFSKGDFSPDIRLRGIVAGRLKKLQAGMLHLCWQIQQVAGGDFTQRVEFMGEFASSFNSMVEQLDSALTALRQKEEELTRLTLALQREVSQKAEALKALTQSEARFRYMAEHDPLTGACNRRSFYSLAAMKLEWARKAGQPCALVLLDLDNFKRFNDTYGHLEGDNALRHLTRTIESGLRERDILGRYGGEEFVLLLPGTNKKDGGNIANRLRRAVASSPVLTKTGPASITVSMGMAFIPADGEAAREMAFLEKAIALADEALYMAKNTGRNKIEVAPRAVA